MTYVVQNFTGQISISENVNLGLGSDNLRVADFKGDDDAARVKLHPDGFLTAIANLGKGFLDLKI